MICMGGRPILWLLSTQAVCCGFDLVLTYFTTASFCCCIRLSQYHSGNLLGFKKEPAV